MNKVIAIVLFAVGVSLLIFGLNASDSIGSEISEVFTGQPSDRAIAFIVGGVAALALGVGSLFIRSRA